MRIFWTRKRVLEATNVVVGVLVVQIFYFLRLCHFLADRNEAFHIH